MQKFDTFSTARPGLHIEPPGQYTCPTLTETVGGDSLSFLREIDIQGNAAAQAAFREAYGCLPNLARAQTLLPHVLDAQAKLETAVRLGGKALSRIQKEQIVLVVAASMRDIYCVTAQANILSTLGVSDAQIEQLLTDYRDSGLCANEVAMMDFCLKLAHYAAWVQEDDVIRLRGFGFDDDSIMEAVLATGLARYLRAMSAGLGPEMDFEPRTLPVMKVSPQPGIRNLSDHGHGRTQKSSFLSTVYRSPKTFAPFAMIQKTHGYIPNFFRGQSSRPDLVEAEAEAIVGVLLPENILNRKQKEYILLAVSAANLNSYCVAVHCNLLRGLGLSPEEGDQIAVDYREANLPQADGSMLDFVMKVGLRPTEVRREDVEKLRQAGFSDEQILESVAVTAVNNFANVVQMGLGIEPDFEPPRVFEQMKVHLLPAESRPIREVRELSRAAAAAEDPDAGLVAEAQGGGLDAFEALVRRHTRTVYRTLVAILGDAVEAQDAMQDVFLSAFKNIKRFQGRSKFSTWLVSISRNAALQRLRERKNFESLDENPSEMEEEFRPRQVRPWQDNPEQQYSASETKQLVEKGIMALPAKYRVVLMLRDIEQLSTDEVAQNLGLSVPAAKTRLLRARLMLREALSPHFAASAGKAAI